MRFVLIGPGALGCLLTSILAKGLSPAEDSFKILDHNDERAQLLNRKGITYEKDERCEQFRVSTCSTPESVGNVDVIFLCVKSYDILSSLSFCKPLLQKDTLLVFLQNGIAHLNVTQHLGKATGVFGSTTEGATKLAPGHVRHAGTGVTYLGFLEETASPDKNLLEQMCLRLERGGMNVAITSDIRDRLWAKLFINVGINAFTALHNCKNGELLTFPSVTDQMKSAIEEAVHVARAQGIHVESDPYQSALSVCRSTAKNVSSMLQDVRANRCTEIEAINGAVVREGKRLGIDTPANADLVAKIKEIEKNYS